MSSSSLPSAISTSSGLVYRANYKPQVTAEVEAARAHLTALRASQEKAAREEFTRASLRNGTRKTYRVSATQAQNYATINEVALEAQSQRINLDTAELNNADILGRVTELARVLKLLSTASGVPFKSELKTAELSTPAEIASTLLSATHLVRTVTAELVGLQEVHKVAEGDLRGLMTSLATSSVTDEDIVALAFPVPDPADEELRLRLEALEASDDTAGTAHVEGSSSGGSEI